MRPQFIQAKKTTIYATISASEVSDVRLKNLVDAYGNALTMSDFGSIGYITVDPGLSTEEIISFTGFSTASDGVVTLTGVTRGLAGVSPYASGGTASSHNAGSIVVVSNNPQTYEAILDYIDGVAIAGASDASLTGKGLVEIATTAEIDADTETGSTGAILATDPSRLALSKYGLRLPSSAQKTFLNGVTGMLVPYAGDSAPSGFLACDGSAVDNDTYSDLAAVLLGQYGYGTGTSCTADAGTDELTATSHGLSNGDIVFFSTTNTLPAGLSANTLYYVINADTNTFEVSTSSGGSAVDISDTGTGTHSFHTQFKVPDLRGSTVFGKGTKVVTFDFTDSDVTTGNDQIVVDSNDYLHNGQAVVLTTSGAVPTGLSASTTYYIIRVDATTIKLASSIANANAGTAVDITAAAGGGTHTLTLTMTARSVGDNGGEENTQMSDSQMPSHTHTNAPGTGYASGGGSSAKGDDGTTDPTGGDEAQNNMPPYVVANWIIKT